MRQALQEFQDRPVSAMPCNNPCVQLWVGLPRERKKAGRAKRRPDSAPIFFPTQIYYLPFPGLKTTQKSAPRSTRPPSRELTFPLHPLTPTPPFDAPLLPPIHS